MMKKKLLIALILVAAILSSLGMTAFAEGQYVDNSAGLLTQSQVSDIESACAYVSETYGCGVYVALLNDCRELSPSGIEPAAEEYYDRNSLGLGSDRNGILLMLSMAERDYIILCHGDIANRAFTDYGKDRLEDVFLDNFRNGDWYGGLADFVDGCGYYLETAAKGQPIDTVVYDAPAKQPKSAGTKLLIAAVPSCAVALIVCLIMKAGMKTAKEKTEASDFIDPQGTTMRIVQDQFTHRTQAVQVIQEPKPSGGGRPGGTSVNSRGFSSRSGKF